MPSPPSSSLRPLLPGSFMQGPYAPMLLTPPGVLPIQAWSHYSVPPPSLFFVSSPLYIFFLLTLILSSRHLSALLYLLVLLSKPLLCMELHSSLPPLPGSIHLVVLFRRKRASQRDPVSQSASTIWKQEIVSLVHLASFIILDFVFHLHLIASSAPLVFLYVRYAPSLSIKYACHPPNVTPFFFFLFLKTGCAMLHFLRTKRLL